MNDVVLDASALLAVLRAEPGAESVEARLEGAIIGAVNLSEVVAKLIEDGVPEPQIRLAIGRLELDVRAFDAEHAFIAGGLRTATLPSGSRSAIAPALPWRKASVRRRSRPTGPGRGSISASRSK